MLVPFGTRVVDSSGKGVGTVSRLILHGQSREAAGVVVHQGIVNRREVVVPLSKVASFTGDEVRLGMTAHDMAGLDIYNSAPLRAMPDHWEMPIGFDQRDFFLLGGDGWTEAVLPFEQTGSAVTHTPGYVRDTETPQDPREPDIAAGMHVYSKDGTQVGSVEAVELDEVTRRVIRITVKHGFLFTTQTVVPASMVGAVTDRISLNVDADTVKKLERR
jgi:sporulation protein YlmC with PRC-barrel domain